MNKMVFVTIDGRQIPTASYLRKKGIIDSYGGIKFLKRSITDNDFALTPDQVTHIVWSIKRYTSVTFIFRYLEILKLFAIEYEKFMNRLGDLCGHDEIKSLKSLNNAIIATTEGLDAIGNGNKLGYQQIANETSFRNRFLYTNGHYDPDFRDLGYDGITVKGPFQLVKKASDMISKISVTACGGNSIPMSFNFRQQSSTVPADFVFTPPTSPERYKTNEHVPCSGIWNPYSFISGCPNYLIEGTTFGEIGLVQDELYNPEYYDEQTKEIIKEDGGLWEMTTKPSKWQLFWEDTRYQDGRIPAEETSYLDDSVAIPPDYKW
jgi:hypothetical protein